MIAMESIKPDEAYIAIDGTGFVEGACFTQSEDADRWVAEKAAGMSIEIRDRADARRIIFTRIEIPMAVFEA
jgi:hypothetical protein